MDNAQLVVDVLIKRPSDSTVSYIFGMKLI